MNQEKNYRMTHQREMILEVVRKNHSHLTADEVYDRLDQGADDAIAAHPDADGYGRDGGQQDEPARDGVEHQISFLGANHQDALKPRVSSSSR